MRKNKTFPKTIGRIFVGLTLLAVAGCGYTTGSLLPSQYRTIYIEPFKNRVGYTTESGRELYVPLLEVKAREAIINRYLFDGHLRVADQDKADLVLKGELTGFERQELRLTDNNDVQEYRIHVIVALSLWDPAEQKNVWTEPSFVGETTYFVTGPQAKPESSAINDALTDLARRVVERTIENW